MTDEGVSVYDAGYSDGYADAVDKAMSVLDARLGVGSPAISWTRLRNILRSELGQVPQR